MVHSARQAGVSEDEHEAALLRAISGVVVEWFGDSGDHGIHCDEITGDAVARDVLARLKSQTTLLLSRAQSPSDQA